MTVRVGMSGFSYPEWIGTFYPPKTKRTEMLERYAERFDTVEINMTFRRMPTDKLLEGWRDRVGDGFTFTLKAPQGITHFRKLVGAGELVDAFTQRATTLGDRQGPILFQIPPKLTFDEGLIDDFCASLPPGPLYAFEPRHESFDERCDAVLQRHGVARCLNDELFEPSSYEVTGPIAYFRLRTAYDDEDLKPLAERFSKMSADGIDVYCYFKHEDDPGSIESALRMAELT